MITNLQKVLEQFSTSKVLIIGDVMIDRYLKGVVDRVSPEAPVPIVNLQQTEERLGGAANVALNIKALGASPLLCSMIGQDAASQSFLKLMPEAGLSARGILQSSDRVTTVKSRVVANNQHLLRMDEETSHDLSEEDETQFLALISDILDKEKIDVILLQDYNKGVLSSPVIHAILSEAIRRGIPTAVDPKQRNFMAYKRATLFKPNLSEVSQALNKAIFPQQKMLRQAAAEIREALNSQYILITLSAKGVYIDESDQGSIIPTQARQIADVCGAGDTVISIAALSLAAGLSLYDIGILSNLGGGQVCERFGVVPISSAQLVREYSRLVSEQQG